MMRPGRAHARLRLHHVLHNALLEDPSQAYSLARATHTSGHGVQTEKAIEIAADIPGVRKEDIGLTADKDVLTLSVDAKAESSKSGEKDGATWHHSERSRRFVQRSLRMPEGADLEGVAARYADGTLHVTVPKREAPAKSKRVAIE